MCAILGLVHGAIHPNALLSEYRPIWYAHSHIWYTAIKYQPKRHCLHIFHSHSPFVVHRSISRRSPICSATPVTSSSWEEPSTTLNVIHIVAIAGTFGESISIFSSLNLISHFRPGPVEPDTLREPSTVCAKCSNGLEAQGMFDTYSTLVLSI